LSKPARSPVPSAPIMSIVGCSATGEWSAGSRLELRAMVYTMSLLVVSSSTSGLVDEAGGTEALAYILHPALELLPRNSDASPTLKMGMASAAPAEALSAMWLQGAVWRVGVTIASTPRKYAERAVAPRLPSSSCDC
jgi:hypothetical protein